jgi:lipopolysaccharide transport system permease protein
MMIWFGVAASWSLLLLPMIVGALVLAALGVGTLLAALTVRYRDFTHITPFLLQVWMYATPVVFPVSLVPPRWQWLLYLNPMTGLIEGFRAVLLGRPPDAAGLAASVLVSLLAFLIAVAYFEKVERQFADVI